MRKLARRFGAMFFATAIVSLSGCGSGGSGESTASPVASPQASCNPDDPASVAANVVQTGPFTAGVGNRSSEYLVLTPSRGGGSGLYVIMHYGQSSSGFSASGQDMLDHTAMHELACSRNLTIVAPTAPEQDWDVEPPTADPKDNNVSLLDAVIVDARQRTGISAPIWLAGLSSGAQVSERYLCAHAERLSGVMSVATNGLSETELAACQPSRPVPLMIVHGTADRAAPYEKAVAHYEHFLQTNGCDPEQEDRSQVFDNPEPLAGDTVVGKVTACTSRRGVALVTVEGGGHNWPSYQYDTVLGHSSGALLFGPLTTGFDPALDGFPILTSLVQ